MASSLPGPTDCCAPDCAEQAAVQIPGPAGATGAAGSNGADGADAFTTNTAGFVMPSSGSNVTVQVGDSDWMAVGQPIFIEGAGTFTVISKPSSLSVTLQNLGYSQNAAATTAIASGKKVSPGGFNGATGATGSPANSPLTTKGDIWTRDASSDVRVAVGANGRRLVADSTQASGMRYDRVDVSSVDEVKNALAIANGGTGQTTKQAAFNALSPVTTRGDLIVRGATNNDRLPIGADGEIPISNGTDPVYAKVGERSLLFSNGPLPRYGLIGRLLGANFNVTTDQAIPIFSGVTKYIVRRIVVVNPDTNLTTAAGGVYRAASKTTPIVSAAQVYTALTGATKFLDLTLANTALTDVLTEAFLYLSLSTPQGGAATADVYIFGENVT